MKTYTTQGTCSRAIEYEVADGVLTACRFIGGCPGNTQGVAKLAVGRKVEDVITLLKGIPCRNGTSCPDQLARALEADLELLQLVTVYSHLQACGIINDHGCDCPRYAVVNAATETVRKRRNHERGVVNFGDDQVTL